MRNTEYLSENVASLNIAVDSLKILFVAINYYSFLLCVSATIRHNVHGTWRRELWESASNETSKAGVDFAHKFALERRKRTGRSGMLSNNFPHNLKLLSYLNPVRQTKSATGNHSCNKGSKSPKKSDNAKWGCHHVTLHGKFALKLFLL